jgi:site-specific recombinase XerD
VKNLETHYSLAMTAGQFYRIHGGLDHVFDKVAGIKKAVLPHIMRHTGVLFYRLNDGDPFSLQKKLGHSDLSMTRKYIQITNMDVKRQHNTFSPLKNILLLFLNVGNLYCVVSYT